MKNLLAWISAFAIFIGLRLSFIWIGPAREAELFERFARAVLMHGLQWTYEHDVELNHPAIIILLAAKLVQVADSFGISFTLLLRIVTSCADLGTAIILCTSTTRMKLRTFTLYALAVAPLTVAGGTGNSDSLCVLLCASALALVNKDRFVLGGFALAAATNIKLIPVLIVLSFLTSCRTRGELKGVLAGFFIGVLPHAITLASVGETFVLRSLLYRPELTLRWGIQSILLPPDDGGSLYAAHWWRSYGSFFMWSAIGLVAAIQLRFRRWTVTDIAATSFLTFVTLAPSFLAHYLVYPAVLLFFRSPPLGFLYSTVAGLLVFPLASLTNAWFPHHSELLGKMSEVGSLSAWGLSLYLLVAFLMEGCAKKSSALKIPA